MKCIPSGAAAFLLVACCINEALSFTFKMDSRLMSTMKTRLHSKAEIMANMTTERAAHIFLGMNRTRARPELLSLIQERLGGKDQLLSAGKLQKLQRTLLRAGKKNEPGSAALKPATDMLNSMMQEAIMKIDTSEMQCNLFERRQYIMMGEAQSDVSSYNSLAASSRGGVLKAQSFIGELNIKIPNTQEELSEHRRSCKGEIATLKYQLKIMNGDIAVMDKILKMIDCSGGAVKAAKLIQTQALVSCAQCNNGDGVIMLQHDGIQPLLQQLQSEVAREYVQDHLSSAYHESAENAEPVALTQEQVHHQMALVKSSLVRHVHGLAHRASVRHHRSEPETLEEPAPIQEVQADEKEKFTAGDLGDEAALPQAGLGKVDFEAAADGSDIIVGLFPSNTIPPADNKFFDFVFGGWGNTKHAIRLGAQGPILAEAPGSLELELGKPLELFVSVDYATGEVSMGDLTETFVTFKADSEEDIALLQSLKHFSISGWEKKVQLYSVKGGNLPLKQAEVPTAPEPFDCVPTTKCTLTPGSCARLQEKFASVKGGIEDKRDETMEALVKLERYCEDTDKSLSTQLVQLGDRLREEQTSLAVATKDQIDAEQQSMEKGQQHVELQDEYQTMMQKCCDEQNEQRSELCALEKIRGELYNVDGERVFITDCAVSDWNEEQCSVNCGGGTRKLFRDIEVRPIGLGMPCPPLMVEEDCNNQPCPVDCVLEDWGGWSRCSAECGGGVRSRIRSVRVEMAHGGAPCDDTEEAESCNLDDCNQNCLLSQWGEWSGCNKQCGTGHRMRHKAITEREKGTGSCPDPQGVERLYTEKCNAFSCASILPRGRSVLQCAAKVDVVILLDSTGSMGEHGWKMSKEMAIKLVKAFNGVGGDFAKVALAVFGEETQWISHLNTGTTLAQVQGVEWMRDVTYTHTALAMAQQELINGREDANSVVIVITDGRPSRPLRTKKAAKSLQEKTRVLWVPIGRKAPIELIREMATSPKEDHIVWVQDLDNMDKPGVLNTIVSDTCPYVM